MERVIISLPTLSNKENIINGSLASALVLKAYQNGIFIPQNATNGDVIKALFPDARVDDYDYGKDPVIDVYGIDDTEYITVRKNWWNSLYKKEGDEK